jgi:hypothetical protein
MSDAPNDASPDDAWNDEFAEQLVGKVLLVGLTFVEATGDRQEQFYGEVISASRGEGIVLRLSGSRDGVRYRLPPDLRGVYPAQPGEYRLRTTNETVSNPDFTATWTIQQARD